MSNNCSVYQDDPVLFRSSLILSYSFIAAYSKRLPPPYQPCGEKCDCYEVPHLILGILLFPDFLSELGKRAFPSL